MKSNQKLLKIAMFIGVTLLTMGTTVFSYGFFSSGSSTYTPIGIGTVVGAVFVFIMAAFFVATEEMLMKSKKRYKVYLR